MSRSKKIVDAPIDYREFETPYTALATMIFVQAVSDLSYLDGAESACVSGSSISRTEILSFLCSKWACFLAESVGIQQDEITQYAKRQAQIEVKNPFLKKVAKIENEIYITKHKQSRAHDLTGKRFGRLVVLERGENYRHKTIRPDGTEIMTSAPTWVCRCDCGQIKTILAANLKSGKQVSCGCFMKEKNKGRGRINGKFAPKNLC